MRASGWLATVAFSLGGMTTLAGPGDAPPGASAERLPALIAGLGSGHFREREAASRELDALGEVALDALRQAVHSADPETRRRAADLIERINTRLTTARILAPTLVALNYKNTPLAEAVD